MSRHLTAALLLIAAVAGSPIGAQAVAAPADVCPGVTVKGLERRFPDGIRRYAFAGRRLEPFVKLWRASRRQKMPASLERVTVYAAPDRPYLVGYLSQGCVMALLTVDREKLERLLRPHIGWPA